MLKLVVKMYILYLKENIIKKYMILNLTLKQWPNLCILDILVRGDKWFDEIQSVQGSKHIRLGVFLLDGTVIGDVALQDIEWKNRSCTIGLGISKIKNRCKGYGTEAVKLILEYGFNNIGLERISASTLEQNKATQRVLEKLDFTLEGIERKAVYFAGKNGTG